MNTEMDAKGPEESTYYTVSFGGNDVSGRAVYNAEGELLRYKEVIKDEPLPDAIRVAITEQYPGYKALKDKEVVKDGDQRIDYYKVKIRKRINHETLYFREDGELMHSKKDKDS